MTVAISTDLVCDDCGAVYEGTRGVRHPLVNYVRAEAAREAGWGRQHRQVLGQARFLDLCAVCWLASVRRAQGHG